MTNIVMAAVVMAIALTEGGDKPGAAGERGPLQITTILVDDLNRIDPGAGWTYEMRDDWNASSAMCREWLLHWAARKKWEDVDNLGHAWNAGPSLRKPSRNYRKRFLNHYNQLVAP